MLHPPDAPKVACSEELTALRKSISDNTFGIHCGWDVYRRAVNRTQPLNCLISVKMKRFISAACTNANGPGLSYVLEAKDSLFNLIQRFELPWEAPFDQLIMSKLNCNANN